MLNLLFLNLNNSPFCMRYVEESINDIYRTYFLVVSHCLLNVLIIFLNSLNVPFNLSTILKSNSEQVITIIIQFIQDAIFVI